MAAGIARLVALTAKSMHIDGDHLISGWFNVMGCGADRTAVQAPGGKQRFHSGLVEQGLVVYMAVPADLLDGVHLRWCGAMVPMAVIAGRCGHIAPFQQSDAVYAALILFDDVCRLFKLVD